MKPGFTKKQSAVWSGFLSAYAALDRAVDADLREHDGITHVEFEVLLRLWSAPERRLRIQELAEASLLTRSGTSRLVDRLAEADLVQREAVTEDGRGTYACLTDDGVTLFERAAPRHIKLVVELFHSRLTNEEADVLVKVWSKLDPG